MPRYNVRRPDGMWQVFSSVSEGFITGPMTFDELRDYRLGEYASPYAETDTLLTDRPRCNVMSYKEASRRSREHGWDEYGNEVVE